jgi:hypothetical protein
VSNLTTEDKQEFMDQVAGKTYDYQISIWGYGGELVYGKLTKAQHDFWQAQCDKTDDDGYDQDDMFGNYIFDQEDFEEDHGITVPEEAKLESEWYECDDIAHTNGVSLGSGYISIDKIDVSEDGPFSRGQVIGEVVESTDLEEFISTNELDSEINELDLDEVGNRDEDGHNYVMYAMSVEKGTFVDCHLELTKPIDLSKLSFQSTEYPNGDTILESILYDGEDVEYEFGDTNGKSMNAYVMDY